jgi:PBP1b-binding outer membrane lipoprotein LpoB
MKTLTVIFCAVFLTGCSTIVPVKRNFPDAPERLMKPCAELKKIEKSDAVLSEVTKIVTENYTLYHECSLKNDAWIEWYNVQKKAFELK